jgi:hypothetical protein
MTGMAKAERADLLVLLRRREKVEKTAAVQRSAELLADFERQMASIYQWDQDEIWAAAKRAAAQATQEAAAAIAARCVELGIPQQFAPGVCLAWRERGENAVAERRAELRRVAQTRIAAIEKAALTEIERRSVELQQQVIVSGLTSDAAQAFIAALPPVESLMPTLDAKQLFNLEPPPMTRAERHQSYLMRYRDEPERE